MSILPCDVQKLSVTLRAAVVLPVVAHLRRQVIQGPTEGIPSRAGGMDGPTEICDLQGIFQANQDVLGLDIPMYDVLLVAVLHRLAIRFTVKTR